MLDFMKTATFCNNTGLTGLTGTLKAKCRDRMDGMVILYCCDTKSIARAMLIIRISLDRGEPIKYNSGS